jgi:hypothetical protein
MLASAASRTWFKPTVVTVEMAQEVAARHLRTAYSGLGSRPTCCVRVGRYGGHWFSINGCGGAHGA